jgi:6-phosphogluconolactonase
MAEINVHRTPEALARAAADLFAARAAEAIAQRGRFCVALSGGSSPRAMHQLLAQMPLEWPRIHLFWGDERCVPPDHEHSSYRMARETLLDHSAIPAENIHRMRGEAEPEQAARDYETELRAFAEASILSGTERGAVKSKDAVLRFDLIYLGMGDDGHTASIFPGSSALRETERWVVAQTHTTPPLPLVTRLTFTPVLLNAARCVAFLVSGASKAERLAQVLHGPYQPEVLPAQIIRPTDGKLLWLVGDDAGRQLEAGFHLQ